jgi:hypothetical protein|tara:strand:+ start:802 stop:1164 length:363 start_codon:yes stop_codon:yes gene_type:complete
MDKFLDLVEDHTPDDSVDRNTKAKLMLYRTLTGKGVKVKNRPMSNFLHIMDDEGNKYKVSIDNIEDAEDQEAGDISDVKGDEAKKAVEDRNQVDQIRVKKFINKTQELKQQLAKNDEQNT